MNKWNNDVSGIGKVKGFKATETSERDFVGYFHQDKENENIHTHNMTATSINTTV